MELQDNPKNEEEKRSGTRNLTEIFSTYVVDEWKLYMKIRTGEP